MPTVDHRKRLLWLLAALIALFALLVSKVADLQLLNPGHYVAFGESQRVRTETLAAERGTIYDRDHGELALSRPGKSVFVDPKLIADPRAAAAQVAPILGLNQADVEAKMRGGNRFAYLARKVDPAVADKVAALGLAGVAFLDETVRYLPAGDLARSVVGTTDVDNNGISGLEQLYGSQLTGTPGQLVLEQNPAGRTIAVGEHRLVPAQRGDDLVLTLDRSLQYESERILGEQIQATGAKGGTVIVSKPSTGEILAMANLTTDPHTGEVRSSSNNAAVTNVYEPGSVMKMVTVSAAIENGLVSPSTVIQVPPSIKVGDSEFKDAEDHGALALPVSDVVAYSSNIGTIRIAQQVGKDRLYGFLKAFGFGERTALGFPNEQSGVVPKPENWWSTSIGTIPIGQGVSVTPLQMLLAYNAVANGGVYVPPRLVSSTVDSAGDEHEVPFADGRRVMSQSTADTMNVMLRKVVTGGTGKLASVEGYTPAGKTGTARKPQPGGGYTDKYGAMHYQSTFVGFVPAEQPALSIIVIIDEPTKGDYTGGAVAAPAFSKIAGMALRQLGVPPPLTDGPAGGAPVTGSSGSAGAANAAAADLVTVEPDGRVRVLPAGEAPPPTTLPPIPYTQPVTSSTTTTASSKAASATSKKP